jgi:hypothetical protein
MLRNIKLVLTGGMAITALAFSSVSFSACLENNLLVGVTGYESEIVTEYGGSTLTCPTNYVGCSITEVTNDGYCIVPSIGTSNTLLIEIELADGVDDPLPTLSGAIIWNESEVTTVENPITDIGGIYDSGTIPGESFSDPATGTIYFYLAKFNTNTGLPEQDESGNLIRARGNTDATITDTAQGANGCFNAFGTDQYTAIAGFERDNNPGSVFSTKAIQFCSDGIKEFTAEAPQPPPKQARCLIGGETAFLKYGVSVTCPSVPAGEQRTIVISKDTETYTDPETGIMSLQRVDGYGFFNENKEIDFNNVCVCEGPDPDGGNGVIHETACIADPSYEGPNKCTVEEGANVPISVTYQNPFCISGVSTGWCW